MKTITITLYKIEELSKEVQQSVIEKYHAYNMDNNHWYYFDFDDFVALCRSVGVAIPNEGISFSGFWSQGDGSTFKSTIDIMLLIKGVMLQAWKSYAPKLDFEQCPCSERVVRLIRRGLITCELKTDRSNRGYRLSYHSEYCIGGFTERLYPNIEAELRRMDIWIEGCLNILNNHLYRSLEDTYNYDTSPEALTEFFMANDYHFTADGEIANRLLDCAADKNEQI